MDLVWFWRWEWRGAYWYLVTQYQVSSTLAIVIVGCCNSVNRREFVWNCNERNQQLEKENRNTSLPFVYFVHVCRCRGLYRFKAFSANLSFTTYLYISMYFSPCLTYVPLYVEWKISYSTFIILVENLGLNILWYFFLRLWWRERQLSEGITRSPGVQIWSVGSAWQRVLWPSGQSARSQDRSTCGCQNYT